jgi:cytochrome c-type biogenesis protein CcmH/NrfG
MSDGLTCRQCGKELLEEAKFCPHCGTKVDQEPKSVTQAIVDVVCSDCGVVNSSDNKFCHGCGIPLSGVSGKAAPVSIAPVSTASPTVAPPAKRQKHPEKKKGKPKKINFSIVAYSLFGLLVVAVALYEWKSNSTPDISSAPPSGVNAVKPNVVSMQELNDLENTVKANPKNSDALLALANKLQDAKFFPRAIETYKKFLVLKPEYADAHVDLGICYFESGDSKKAISEIEGVLAADPKHQMAMFNLGIIQLNAGNLTESSKWFKKTIALDSTSFAGKKAQELLQQHSK